MTTLVMMTACLVVMVITDGTKRTETDLTEVLEGLHRVLGHQTNEECQARGHQYNRGGSDIQSDDFVISVDVTGAFLQGEKLDRETWIFARVQ